MKYFCNKLTIRARVVEVPEMSISRRTQQVEPQHEVFYKIIKF